MGTELKIEELAKRLGGSVKGDAGHVIGGVAGIEEAASVDVTFVSNPKYASFISKTKAGAVLVGKGVEAKGKNLIVVDDPYLAFAKCLEIFRPAKKKSSGIHASVVIHESVRLGKDASVGANVVIEEGVTIGDNAVIYPGVYIGSDTVIGDDVLLYSNVSIREGARLGSRVIIHCNSVIGSDGFGYAKGPRGAYKVPQTGNVIIGDDVELGACVTIDRGTLGSTVIGSGSKIDNLVQIAHNVEVGANSIIVSQVGISGSTKIGSRVTIAGQTGVAGHLEVADDTTIGAKSGVTNDIKEKGVYTGYPAIAHREWLSSQGVFSRLPELRKKIIALEKRVQELEEKKK